MGQTDLVACSRKMRCIQTARASLASVSSAQSCDANTPRGIRMCAPWRVSTIWIMPISPDTFIKEYAVVILASPNTLDHFEKVEVGVDDDAGVLVQL